jgi:hypothetical protein
MPKQNRLSKPPQVPRTTVKWMRLVLGFSVSVAVGLAPFLGRLQIPLFTPMLSLIPVSLQDVAIPVSAASMGVVAIIVQWNGAQSLPQNQLRRWFRRSLLFCVASLVFLVMIEMLAVVRVDVRSINDTASFAVGLSQPTAAPCTGLSRAECIKTKLTLDESKIDSYFGEVQANSTKLILVLVYVTFMSAFAALVGALSISK